MPILYFYFQVEYRDLVYYLNKEYFKYEIFLNIYIVYNYSLLSVITARDVQHALLLEAVSLLCLIRRVQRRNILLHI